MNESAFGIPKQIFINSEGVYGNNVFKNFKRLENEKNSIDQSDFTFNGNPIPIKKEDRKFFVDSVETQLRMVASRYGNEINKIVKKLKTINVDDDDDSDGEYGGGRRRRKRKSRRRRKKSMKKSRKSRKSRGRKRKSRRRTRRRR